MQEVIYSAIKTSIDSAPAMILGAVAGWILPALEDPLINKIEMASLFGLASTAASFAKASTHTEKLGAGIAGYFLSGTSTYLLQKIYAEKEYANGGAPSVQNMVLRRTALSFMTFLTSYAFSRNLVLSSCLASAPYLGNSLYSV